MKQILLALVLSFIVGYASAAAKLAEAGIKTTDKN